MTIYQRWGFGTLTADIAEFAVKRLTDLLTNHTFSVVEVRSNDPTRPRIRTDGRLSVETWPYLDAPISVDGQHIEICMRGQRWHFPFGCTFDFKDDQVRFVVEQFGVTYVFAVHEEEPSDE